MSPVKRPSSVTGMRKAMAAPSAEEHRNLVPVEEPELRPAPSRSEKPVRVTLNMPPELFRQLDHWTRDAADTIGVPRLGVQDALRAIVLVATGDQSPNLSAHVLAELRRSRA